MDSQDKMPNGSGVLFWEIYKSTVNKKIGLALILFGSQRKSGFVFSDCGGSLNERENVKLGALREAQEESSNMFFLQQQHLTVSVRTKNYICYNMFVYSPKGELRSTTFQDNLKKMKDATCPFAWRESKSMKRFFIEDLIKQKILNSSSFHFNAVTANNENVVIHSRCVGVIKEVLRAKLINLTDYTLSIPSIEISLKPYILSQTSKLTFLKGTNQFIIDKYIENVDASIQYQKQIMQILTNQINNEQYQEKNSYGLQNQQIIPQNGLQIQNIMTDFNKQNYENDTIEIEEDQPIKKIKIQQNNINIPFFDILQNYNITNKDLISKIQNSKNQRRGSGVIIIATNQIGEQGFLLVQDKKGICSDMGGTSSSHEINIMEAGIRELKEETSNTFNLCENHLNQNNSIRLQNYMCYPVHIQTDIPTLQKVFTKNVSSLLGFGESVPRCWRGKQQIYFFPIKQNINYFQNFDINADLYEMVDSTNTKYVIRDRTAIILHALILKQIHLNIPIQKVILEDNSQKEFIFNNEFSFLTKTSSYVFQ